MLGTNSDCYNQNFSRQLWKFGVAEKEELSNVAKPKKQRGGKLLVRTGHSNVTATNCSRTEGGAPVVEKWSFNVAPV